MAKSNLAEFRRKHRWRVQMEGTGITPQDWLYLQKAARPSFKYNEAQVHHNQEVAYFAGKQEWDPVELIFYDASGDGGQNGNMSQLIWNWLAESGGGNPGIVSAGNVRTPSEYKKKMIIEMLDGLGGSDASKGGETWELFGAWPVSSNWNDLDYTNTEIQLVTVSLRFDRAIRTA
jgi:hypothetical protein